MNVAIPRDTLVVCPKCDARIAMAKRDILMGEKVNVTDFFQLDSSVTEYHSMKCSTCGEYYARKNPHPQLHTKDGWIP